MVMQLRDESVADERMEQAKQASSANPVLCVMGQSPTATDSHAPAGHTPCFAEMVMSGADCNTASPTEI